MKLMFASDIHGSAYYAEKMLDTFQKEQAENLILLGDLLYHGPRNDLPRGYNPKQVISLLNPLKEKIVCVRGNCDLCSFAPDTDIVPLGSVKAFITHGHLYHVEYNRVDSLVYAAQEQGCRVAMFGHTHSAYNETVGGVSVINPGTAGKGRNLTWALVTVFDNGGVVCEIKPL